jgi:N-acetyl-anhydromuramyl-L-alanine amidase AmpD
LRLQKDLFNQQLDPTPSLIILHETVYDLESAVNTLLTPHPSDSDQVSYHTLVARNGEIIQLVQPELRAYGAGNSAFNGRWIFSNKDLSGSINNFALHVSLETPIDGSNDFESHGGYSSEQYDSLTRVLADWMVRYEIPADRITTHKFVDLGGERSDPRSFDWKQLQKRLGALDLICKK